MNWSDWLMEVKKMMYNRISNDTSKVFADAYVFNEIKKCYDKGYTPEQTIDEYFNKICKEFKPTDIRIY